MRIFAVVLVLCLLAVSGYSQNPPPTPRYLIEADDTDTSVVTAKSPNTVIGFQSLLSIWKFQLYTGGASYATYDSNDVIVDGDVLTYTAVGNVLDWQQPPGAGGGTTDSIYWKRTDSTGSDRWVTPDDTLWHDTTSDFATLTDVFLHSDQPDTALGTITIASDIIMFDGRWIGLGAAAGRIDFWDYSPDTIQFFSAALAAHGLDFFGLDNLLLDTIRAFSEDLYIRDVEDEMSIWLDDSDTSITITAKYGYFDYTGGYAQIIGDSLQVGLDLSLADNDIIGINKAIGDTASFTVIQGTGSVSGTIELFGATTESIEITVADNGDTVHIIDANDDSLFMAYDDDAGNTVWKAPSQTLLILPDSIGTTNYTDGTIDAADMADEDHGDVSWTSGVATVEGGQADSAYHSDSTNLIHINVRNNSGGSLTKGSPVKNNGFNVGTGEILVILASASSSDSMPAIGILDQTLSNNSSGTATVSGVFAGTASSNFKTDSAGWADKDGIYVGAGQVGLTDARPTNGATVQKLGEITRTHATLGSINVSGAGRTNDIPNMASAGFFIGGPDSVGVVQIISGEGTIDSTGVLTIADDAIDSTNILDGSIFESDLDVSNTPTDNYILSYNDAGKNFTWVAGGAGESNTLSDTGTFDDVSGFGLVTAKVGVDLRMRGLIEGSNITITQSGDTGLIVTGAAGGSGTTDSSYINDGTEYGPFTNDMFKIKESTGIDITREDSTTYDVFQFAATLGTSIDSSEIEANQVGESELDLGTGAQQIGIVDMAGTAWRVFYTNGSGVMTELALGADGTYLESNGAAAAPTFTTPAGSGTGHWDSLGTDSLFWIDADVDTNMIIYDDDAGTVTWAIDVNQSFLKIGTANADSVQIGPAGLTRADSLKILGQFRLVFGGDTAWWSTADAGTDGQVLHIDRTNDSMYWDDDDGAIDSTWESIRVDSARIDTLTSDTITTTDLAVTNLLISGDQITDLNGVGLKVVSTVLAVDTAAAVADAEPLPVSGNAVYDYVLANYATPSMVGDTADILRAEMPDSITTLNLFPQFSRTYFDTTLAGDDSLQVIFADSSGATDTTNATLTTYVENLAGDSLAEYSTLIGQITDDTTSWKNAADTVAAWDNAALDSNNFKDAGISLPEDLNTFTEAELETALSDVTALFTNNVTGDVTVSGGTSTLGANTVDSTHVVANALSIPSDLAQATKAELEGRMSDVSDFAEADGDTWTGTHDFGGATALEIPNGVNPTITNEGEIAWDTDDDAFEVTDGTNDMLLTVKKIVSPLIWNPDLITDTVPILYIDSLVYPGGIEIIRAEVQTSEDGAYALKLMYFTAADPPVFSEWIDTLNVGASDQRFASNTFDNSAIAVGQIIYMLTPATDIDWIRWSLTFYVKENN